jgi:stage II sporulation protein AA (anti-sigma F factor antagonist)
MRKLVASAKAVSGKGGRLVLLAPVPPVRQALETAGIHTIVPVFDDQDAAVADLRAALAG